MAFCDFVIKYDPSIDTPQTVTKKIIYSIINKRMKAKKPTVIFVGGDSGEGKSESALTLSSIILENEGIDIKDYIDVINIYSPVQYAKKIDKLLFDKEYKKVNTVIIHEARELIKAKLWYSFLNTSISDINAMSRSVKRMCTIVISQFIKDIDSSIRYTLTYYITVRRPKGQHARLYINVLWKDDRDLEKPKLRKRKLSGYLWYPSGIRRRYVPEYLEVKRPPKDIIEIFENQDREAKAAVIRKKLERLMKEIDTDIGVKNDKVNHVVSWYITNRQNLTLIGKTTKKGFRTNADIKKLHDFTDEEAKEFQFKLNEKLKIMDKEQEGLINNE
jgi:predicted RNA-binding protein Jag